MDKSEISDGIIYGFLILIVSVGFFFLMKYDVDKTSELNASTVYEGTIQDKQEYSYQQMNVAMFAATNIPIQETVTNYYIYVNDQKIETQKSKWDDFEKGDPVYFQEYPNGKIGRVEKVENVEKVTNLEKSESDE